MHLETLAAVAVREKVDVTSRETTCRRLEDKARGVLLQEPHASESDQEGGFVCQTTRQAYNTTLPLALTQKFSYPISLNMNLSASILAMLLSSDVWAIYGIGDYTDKSCLVRGLQHTLVRTNTYVMTQRRTASRTRTSAEAQTTRQRSRSHSCQVNQEPLSSLGPHRIWKDFLRPRPHLRRLRRLLLFQLLQRSQR